MKDLLSLYFIMGTPNSTLRPLQTLQRAIDGGITMFQLREKGDGALSGEAKWQFAIECRDLCRRAHIPFIVNDDVSLALEIEADGVHVGQGDMKATQARKLLGPDKIIGVSCHTVEEVEVAQQQGAQYVGMGPVYDTTTKQDTNPVAGTSAIEAARRRFPQMPIVAIGGLTLDNCSAAIEAGADGIAVISTIAQHTDPERQTASLMKKIEQVKRYAND